MRNKLFIILASIIVTSIIIGGIFFFMIPTLPEKPSEERLISFFNQNKDLFYRVAKYFDSIDGDVKIDKRRGNDLETMIEIVTKDGKKTFTISKEIRKEVKTLLNKYGFVGILESESYIFFYKTLGFQWYQAIIFSKDGREPPLNRIREYEEIGEGWYYYYGE